MFNKLPLLLVILFTACQERIIHDLNELDANKIISKLYQAEIDAKKEKQADGLWSIAVGQEKVIDAIQLIEDYRFFKKPELSEPHAKLLSSEQEEKLQYENSLAKQLEATLQSLSGVLEAHVHYNLNFDQTIWNKGILPKKDSSAGVLLIVNHQFALNTEELKQLVGGASGVDRNQINIVISYPPLLEQSVLKSQEQNLVVANTQNVVQTEINRKLEIIFTKLLNGAGLTYLWCVTLLLSLLYLILKYQQLKKVKNFKIFHSQKI